MGMIATRLAATAAATAAAVVARRAVEIGWTYVRGEEPPTASDVADDTELRDLLLWSAIVAVSVIVARRLAASKTKDLLGS